MNLTSAPQIKSLLAEYGLRPKKRLGQNFLIDRNVLNRLIESTEAGPKTNILEIGPGLGVVTLELASRGANVICIEADKDFQPILQKVLSDFPDVNIVIEDVLKVDLPELLQENKWVVVGNLPYYITSPIIAKLIESKHLFSSILLMVQREVAQRLQAAPGSSDYGALSVFVQYHCEIEDVMKVSRNVFYPIPDVDSELIKLIIRKSPAVDVRDKDLFFNIVRASFGKRRKTLFNALGSSGDLKWDKEQARIVLEAAGIDGNRRGETLSLEEFANLANASESIND